MKNRLFPRYDIKTVSRGDEGYAAFLIDHDTGETWMFDSDLSWKPIKKKKGPPNAETTEHHLKTLGRAVSKPKKK